ncbi:MAG: lipid-A-disaccharide synthase [Syntrophorhabdus sp. PtaU1.Bin002]|nr:MAG: lipid-A-disaccharide synthase [Syntrophorhabdus sp. PtaB.Bin006]OPY67420.1 MAG: lipid-A-disaccharide synthase [Syntrophorhabdus sp. PtaU1.Bin002]
MSTFWMVLGFVAQAFFSARFLVQWVASERAGRSVVPVVFWHLSILGTVLLLAYAIYRKDPVFILGQSAGLIVYFRNLFLIWREKRTVSE